MAIIPKNPEEIFGEFTADMKKAFGEGLQSIILYGSGARGDYRPGKSDINFLIVLSEEGIDAIDRASGSLRRWRKKMVTTPLFMTQTFICTSLGAYPVEFLNMKRSYVVVYGGDVLKNLSFDPVALRHQCERELRGKLLLLRTAFLETRGKADRIRNLVRASLTAFLSLFQALLHLRGRVLHENHRDTISAMAEAYQVDRDILLQCLAVKEEKESLSSGELKALFEKYVNEIKKLWETVDKTEI
ncbi:MAG: nucleotidyltransferase domain-containing protein [Deltaproteobacteria bacterium]|nr:nucleotidyltransferase domain-containing protein [Deltaproteobacteria bacterium]